MSKDDRHNSTGENNPRSTNNAVVHMVTLALFVLILLIFLFAPPETGYRSAKMLAGIINFIFEIFGHIR